MGWEGGGGGGGEAWRDGYERSMNGYEKPRAPLESQFRHSDRNI